VYPLRYVQVDYRDERPLQLRAPVNVELPTGSTQLNNILASSRVVVQGWPVKFSIRE